MDDSHDRHACVEIDEIDVETARRLALARLVEVQRQQSAHRPTSRNPVAQYRGAAGEIAARKWIRLNGIEVESGFEADKPTDSDLTVGSIRIEVMTAQIEHRKVTGLCVPPGKFRAAARRGAVGYLFVGTGPEREPRRFLIQNFCKLAVVDLNEPVYTRVSDQSPAVLNYVVSANAAEPPYELIRLLSSAGG